jgi:hypothetical protein
MPLSGVQNPVVFTCWFAAVCHALSPMASISADLRLFCARMSATEIGLQAIYYMLAFLLGLLGPAVFFVGHDPLHLFNMPFHFRWQLSLMLTAGGLTYACVLAVTRRLFALHAVHSRLYAECSRTTCFAVSCVMLYSNHSFSCVQVSSVHH